MYTRFCREGGRGGGGPHIAQSHHWKSIGSSNPGSGAGALGDAIDEGGGVDGDDGEGGDEGGGEGAATAYGAARAPRRRCRGPLRGPPKRKISVAPPRKATRAVGVSAVRSGAGEPALASSTTDFIAASSGEAPCAASSRIVATAALPSPRSQCAWSASESETVSAAASPTIFFSSTSGSASSVSGAPYASSRAACLGVHVRQLGEEARDGAPVAERRRRLQRATGRSIPADGSTPRPRARARSASISTCFSSASPSRIVAAYAAGDSVSSASSSASSTSSRRLKVEARRDEDVLDERRRLEVEPPAVDRARHRRPRPRAAARRMVSIRR